MPSISKAVGGAAAGVAGASAWSRLVVDRARPLGEPVPADDVRALTGPLGDIALYTAGAHHDDEPVLLVHSVNAAASAYEMRPLFEHLRDLRPTYAIDLPGYGHSTRSPARHTRESMTAAVTTALDATGPAHVVALSLSAEFVAQVAIERPELVRSLGLLSPTGMRASSTAREVSWLESFLGLPIVGRTAFDLLTTRASIRWFLGRSFEGEPDPGLVDFAYDAAHQPHAEVAPAAFLSGRLFTPDAIDRLYVEVPVPMLVLYDRDPYTDFARLPELVERGRDVAAVRIPDTCGLPHFEQLAAVTAALDEVWAR